MQCKDHILLDYFDHQLFSSSSTHSLHLQFKFDLLAFFDRNLLVAAPALAKNQDALYISILYSMLWETGRMKYVLSPQYNGNFDKYTFERLKKLEKSLPEKQLLQNFEFEGYTAQYWKVFFDGLLKEHLNLEHPFQTRMHDADTLFREYTKYHFIDNNDVMDLIYSEHSIDNVDGIVCNIANKCDDQSNLFQREVVLSDLNNEFNLGIITNNFIEKSLDLKFAEANAKAVNAITTSSFSGLNGKKLLYICNSIPVSRKQSVKDIVQELSPITIIKLSTQTEWQDLVIALNYLYVELLKGADNNPWIALVRARNKIPKWNTSFNIELVAISIAYVLGSLCGALPPVLERIVNSMLTGVPSKLLNKAELSKDNTLNNVLKSVVKMRNKLWELYEYDSQGCYNVTDNFLKEYGMSFNLRSGFKNIN